MYDFNKEDDLVRYSHRVTEIQYSLKHASAPIKRCLKAELRGLKKLLKKLRNEK